MQRAKNVVSDSPGLVNSVLNSPDGQVKIFGEFELRSPKKYPYPPSPEGTFVLIPPTPCNFCNFPTWLGTPWKKIFRPKMPLHYIFMRKIIVS